MEEELQTQTPEDETIIDEGVTEVSDAPYDHEQFIEASTRKPEAVTYD